MFISCFWRTFGRDFLKKNSHLSKFLGGHGHRTFHKSQNSIPWKLAILVLESRIIKKASNSL
jgi:hypothetical protein